MNNVHTEHFANAEEFCEKFSHIIPGTGQSVIPYVIYDGDEHYNKTLFGFEGDLKPLQYNDQELSERKLVRKTLKKSKVKIARGESFVFRKTPVGHEIIPGYGIVLSNLFGRLWEPSDLEQMVSMPNVRGVLWEVSNEGLIYYEATDTPGPQVQTMWYGDDS
jgi:hypothetical protein